jgi:dienelactone hydrolase
MKPRLLLTIATAITLASCEADQSTTKTETPATDSAKVDISGETLRYKADTTNSASFVAYNKAETGARPVVLIIPEWWGMTDYPKMRAKELAGLGYFAFAVDMYGEGRQGESPDEAGKLAGAFYTDSNLVRSRIAAAMAQLHNFPQADTTKIAIMGYCFGGTMSLKAVKLGFPLKGAVSFHGGLAGTASANAPELILHGGADSFVPDPEVAAWRKSMDSLHADYTFHTYPGATHAFTNPMATEKGRKYKMPIEYNAVADSSSWAEMKTFFKKIF